MRNLILRICRWGLALLGISSLECCRVMYGSPVVMYGVPSAEYGVPTMEYRVTGKVQDAVTEAPVEGIEVKFFDSMSGPRTTHTSEEGEFEVVAMESPNDKVVLQFVDVDGEENGVYISEDIEVSLVKAEDGDGNWSSGVYIAEDVLVKLEPDLPVEYGTPIVEFSVKGRVVDADAEPVENIEVSAVNYYESVRTAQDGTFHLSGEMTGFEMKELTLCFTDTDGEENGGEFEKIIQVVPMTQTGDGDGKWDNGDYQADNVVVVLKKKE